MPADLALVGALIRILQAVFFQRPIAPLDATRVHGWLHTLGIEFGTKT
jgi:hypothetical protein